MELAKYIRDDDRNKFWKLPSGVAQNLLDEAIDRIADLEAALTAAQERNTALQSEHLDHVNALHEQLTAMTAERDSETRWAKQYSDEADELRQQLAAAQENTLGPWFLTQGLCTLDAIADHIITLQRQLTAAQERGVVLARGILAVQNLINESRGVDGYHRNGNIAEWDELLDDGCMLDEYSKALHLIHKTTTDSLRELPAPPEQEADHAEHQ